MRHCPHRIWQFPAGTALQFSRPFGNARRVVKLKVTAILKAHIPVTDQFRIGCYPTASRLAEDFIQLHDRDGAACDHLAQHRTGSDRR